MTFRWFAASHVRLLFATLTALIVCTMVSNKPSLAQEAQHEVIEGIGKAKDGDGILVGDREVRLAGIDAPELGQICKDSSGASYPCGKKATAKLQSLLSKGKLYCQKRGPDGFGRPLAECWIVGEGSSITNVNEAMVMAGLAFAFTKFSEEYTALEALAQRQKAGLWAGQFEFPWEYRERQKPTPEALAQPVPMPLSGAKCPPTRPYCKNVRSCNQACFLLQECGYGGLDRDNDGIPCENVCRRPCR